LTHGFLWLEKKDSIFDKITMTSGILKPNLVLPLKSWYPFQPYSKYIDF